MTLRKITVLAVLGAALAAGLAVTRAQQPDTDREVEEAKALYREANFSDAILKLQSAIEHLKLARDLEAKRVQLGDAYLHMALSYFALDNRAAARENLKGMLRLDRERRLDAQIYAPPVIELLEDARRELAQELPAPGRARAAAMPSPSPAQAKRGSKTVPILLGAGAAVAGIAVAAGGGGGSSVATMPGASSTTTPSATPAPTPSGSRDIVFLGSSPPSGSAFSVSRDGPQITATVSVLYNQSGNYTLFMGDRFIGQTNWCFGGDSVPFALTAGRAQNVTVTLRYPFSPTSCPPLPYSIIAVRAALNPIPRGDGQPVLDKDLAVTYTVNP